MEKRKFSDPGKEVEERIKEVFKNPPAFDRLGVKFSEKPTYRQAFEYVLNDDIDLCEAYLKTLKPEKKFSEKEVRAQNAGKKIVELVNNKMKCDKTLSYSEALSEIQRENKSLILEYLGR